MWAPLPEVLWKVEPELAAARAHTGWAAFHRACGKVGFYFDHPRKDGRRWVYDCFTSAGLLATGHGKSLLDALAEAYRLAGRANGDTDAALNALLGKEDSFDDLL